MNEIRWGAVVRRMGCARGVKLLLCFIASGMVVLLVVYHAKEYAAREEKICLEKLHAKETLSPVIPFDFQQKDSFYAFSSDTRGTNTSSASFDSTGSTNFNLRAGATTESNFTRLLRTLQTKRFLPNFFIHGRPRGRGDVYSTADIVFVHNVKAGGSSVKHVLTRLAKKYGMPVINTFDANSTRNATKHLAFVHPRNASSKMAIMGGCSFGVCDVPGTGASQRPCSYITMIRHPVDRIISMFLFCQQTGFPCSDRDIPRDGISLEDWAIERGSHFFRQLTAEPNTCEIDAIQYDNFNTNQRRAVLNLVLNNLANWFSAIGITEEFDASLRMFESVYRLPFTEMLNHPLNEGKLKNEMGDGEIADMRGELLRNPVVMDALYEDMMIYERAKEIFDLQKTVLSAMR